MRFDEWSEREDRCARGGKPIPFTGCDQIDWIVSIEWPTQSLARLTIREYMDGQITLKLGRVWIPGMTPDEDDGA